MTIFTRLEQWRQQGILSPEQQLLLAGLARGEPYSLFLELNILLYAGILIFIAGLGWTVSTWSQQLGDVLVIVVLSAIFVACLWYCFSRAPAWSPAEVSSPSLIFDYILYLGNLVWAVEMAYLQKRFPLLSEQSDLFLLVSAGLFFLLAYRFDNRLVLSLALSSLAGYFGLTISHWPAHQDSTYRQSGVIYSVLLGAAGFGLQRRGLKPHFLGTYLNIAANVLFWALLSGVFNHETHFPWFLVLLAACGASIAWGISQRQFSFVAYAAVYGYVGVSYLLVRNMQGTEAILSYFVLTGVAMLTMLILMARRFGREA